MAHERGVLSGSYLQNLGPAFEGLPDGVLISDAQGRIVHANGSAEAMFGYSSEELIGRPVDLLVPGRQRDAHAYFRAEYYRHPRVRLHSSDLELACRRKDGSEFPADIALWPVRTDEGFFIISAVRDTTERKLAAQRLRESETRYRTLVEQIPAITHISGLEESSPTVYISPQVEAITGYTPEEWQADPDLWVRLLHRDDRDRVLEENRGFLAGAGEFEFQSTYRVVARDGRVVWIHERASIVHDDDGRPLHVHGVMLDITARREVEEELRRSEERYRSLVEVSPDAILVHVGGQIRFVNDAAVRLFGAGDGSELIGRRVLDLVEPGYRGHVRERVEREYAGASSEVMEQTALRLDGSPIRVEVAAAPMLFEGERAAQVVIRDVSDRERALGELTRSLEELRAVDEQRRRLLADLVTAQEEERRRVAGEIHDDSVQTMVAVSMRLEMFGARHPELLEEDRFGALAESVQDAIARLRRLMLDLRPPLLDTEGLVAALRNVTQRGERVEGEPECHLEAELTQEPPHEVRILLFRIAQEALANIRKHARASRVDILVKEQDQGVLMRITDDGLGFDASGGAGSPAGHLGLTSMRERAEVAGGRVTVASTPGRGTTVEAWVPDPDVGNGG